MKVAGIIAEYNPFHNGHAYHIEEARKKTGADYVVVVMSGNFVQRGAPAIIDKYTRTKMALLGGADLIIELPVVAATASAETFAQTGVALLHSLGCVTHLGFGCETDDLELLDQLAELFLREPGAYKAALSSYLKMGLSYPAARAKSTADYFKTIDSSAQMQAEKVLSSPNNILAIEYLKALKRLRSSILPCPILRQGHGYHDDSITGTYVSATAIRKKILSYSIDNPDMSLYAFLENHIPAASFASFMESLKSSLPISEHDFSNLLAYKLLLEQGNFAEYADIKEDLAHRIDNQMEHYLSYTGFIDDLKTKNLTYTAISRGLLHILLNIKQADVTLLEQLDYAPYVRLLGFQKKSAELLQALKHSSLPVLTQLAKDQYKLSEEAMHLLQLDITSSNIYTRIKDEKLGLFNSKNEYRTPLIYV